MSKTLPDTLLACHDLILSQMREIAQLKEELKEERDWGFRMIDDREFLAEVRHTARVVGTTELGFYGRVADPCDLNLEVWS